jgi:hypothetical protein
MSNTQEFSGKKPAKVKSCEKDPPDTSSDIQGRYHWFPSEEGTRNSTANCSQVLFCMHRRRGAEPLVASSKTTRQSKGKS